MLLNMTYVIRQIGEVLMSQSNHVSDTEYWTVAVPLKVKVTRLHVGAGDGGQEVSSVREEEDL